MAKTRQKKEKDALDQLLANIDFRGLTQDEVVGKDGLIKQLTGRILQRALEAEMTEHLGYEKNSNSGDNTAKRTRLHPAFGRFGDDFKRAVGRSGIAVFFIDVPIRWAFVEHSEIEFYARSRRFELISRFLFHCMPPKIIPVVRLRASFLAMSQEVKYGIAFLSLASNKVCSASSGSA